ncbi:adenylate/guanylate cyclase domain-containing protein [Nisaea denitrificans]|uniref:adenylate/guanylate cyclase domain-containing protein n=1 Tax=Nisaea denitrificans TaxID=390877 RepID=UPI00041D9556|nr:adenylate/guanylate cyclase domain-containing protein [Nisaea denitrificans]
MKISTLKAILDDEVSTILSTDFSINVSPTSVVPGYSDGGVTFPNLDAKQQSSKLLDSCVLYVDIRRSTDLNLAHKPETVAKLYSAFVRAMTQCAERNNGHVRGIIGDRVMVLFDSTDCYVNAVETAISMNSTAIYVINKYFKRNEFSCGIGIDAGKMLATKTGFRKRGVNRETYRSLVWLGRPANVASKLTDSANKTGYSANVDRFRVGRQDIFGDFYWSDESSKVFLESLKTDYVNNAFYHTDRSVFSFYFYDSYEEFTPSTPPILMTKKVFDGFKLAAPKDSSIAKNLWKTVSVHIPGYTGDVIGGNVVWTDFK